MNDVARLLALVSGLGDDTGPLNVHLEEIGVGRVADKISGEPRACGKRGSLRTHVEGNRALDVEIECHRSAP